MRLLPLFVLLLILLLICARIVRAQVIPPADARATLTAARAQATAASEYATETAPTRTPVPTVTPWPTWTPLPTATDTPTPEPTRTATPQPTPIPTRTATTQVGVLSATPAQPSRAQRNMIDDYVFFGAVIAVLIAGVAWWYWFVRPRETYYDANGKPINGNNRDNRKRRNGTGNPWL